MAGEYLPQGLPVLRTADGEIAPVLAPLPYTQTYSTAARTVPAATVAAVTEAVAAVAPAGGTGAAAGCWDTAGNRNTAITTINECRALANSLKTQGNALRADIVAQHRVLNAIINDLKRTGLLAG